MYFDEIIVKNELTDIGSLNGPPLIAYKLVVNFDGFNAILKQRTELSDFQLLEERLLPLYEFKYKKVEFHSMEEDFSMSFELTEGYHIKVYVRLFNGDSSGKLEFHFLMGHCP